MHTTKKIIYLLASAMLSSQPIISVADAHDIINTGYLVSGVTSDGKTISVPITNNTGDDDIITAYAAVYRNGKLINVSSSRETVPGSKSAVLELETNNLQKMIR